MMTYRIIKLEIKKSNDFHQLAWRGFLMDAVSEVNFYESALPVNDLMDALKGDCVEYPFNDTEPIKARNSALSFAAKEAKKAKDLYQHCFLSEAKAVENEGRVSLVFKSTVTLLFLTMIDAGREHVLELIEPDKVIPLSRTNEAFEVELYRKHGYDFGLRQPVTYYDEHLKINREAIPTVL
jgi:hypothetical protein